MLKPWINLFQNDTKQNIIHIETIPEISKFELIINERFSERTG